MFWLAAVPDVSYLWIGFTGSCDSCLLRLSWSSCGTCLLPLRSSDGSWILTRGWPVSSYDTCPFLKVGLTVSYYNCCSDSICLLPLDWSDWQLFLTSGFVWLAAVSHLWICLTGSYLLPLDWSDWQLSLTSGLVWLAAVSYLWIGLTGSFLLPLDWSDWQLSLTSGLAWLAAVSYLWIGLTGSCLTFDHLVLKLSHQHGLFLNKNVKFYNCTVPKTTPDVSEINFIKF
jgi:hypothetical protein